jgi:hypothetical protein
MPHKNDYTCIVFYKNDKPKKWQFVHSLSKFVSFLNGKHPNWQYLNVYDRRTGKYLKRFYPGNIIPYFLAILPFALVLHFFLTFNNNPHRLTFTYGFNNTTTIRNAFNQEKGGLCLL